MKWHCPLVLKTIAQLYPKGMARNLTAKVKPLLKISTRSQPLLTAFPNTSHSSKHCWAELHSWAAVLGI